MQVIIESKDVEINDKTKDLIVEKLGKDLDRLLKNFSEDVKTAEVRVKSGARWGYRISFSMWLPKKEHIFAETKHENLDIAVTRLKDEVQEIIRRYKEKIQDYR